MPDKITNLRRAAERGDAKAQTQLADAYYLGRGVERDQVTAREWYERAAAQDDVRGIGNVANFYAKGLHGLPRDPHKALELYRRALSLGAEYSQSSIDHLEKVLAGGLPQIDPRRAKQQAEGLAALVKHVGLPASLSARLRKAARTSARLLTSRAKRVVGASRFGGLPDLPPKIDWPQSDDTPLSFVAQLRLADLKLLDSPALPTRGTLWFFVDRAATPFDMAPAQWRVLYSGLPAGKLVSRKPPRSLRRLQGKPFPARSIEVAAELTLPGTASYSIDRLKLGSDEARYAELLDEYAAHFVEAGDRHRVFGHADCGAEDPRAQLHEERTGRPAKSPAPLERWRLLLQLSSQEDLKMSWGGGGTFYFWIHEKDLAARAFDEVQLTFDD